MPITNDASRFNPEDAICKHTNGFSDKKNKKLGKPTREYTARNSLLTDLFENTHINTIYYIFLLIFFCLFVNTVTYDYLYRKRIRMGFITFAQGFSNIHYSLTLWIGMVLASFLSYFGLAAWALVRVQLGSKSTEIRKIWDFSAIAMVILYYVIFLTVVPKLMVSMSLHIGETAALVCDNLRILMKCHAFIRSNVPRVLAYKPHMEDQILYPTVKQFVYFSFIPATIYQDEYPRTKKINWHFVRLYLSELFASMMFLSCLVEIYFINPFEEFGIRKFEIREVAMLFVKTTFPSLLMVIVASYFFFHVWLNLFAELLRFSDRRFYLDWWNSDSFGRYYTTGNVVVQDRLYNYVYIDCYETITSKNKLASKVLVIFISAMFHEYLVAFTLGCFMPTLFVSFFVIGIPVALFLRFKSKSVGIFFFWCALTWFASVLGCLYTLEYYCRYNTKTINSNWIDLFTPKLFNCLL